MKRNVTENFFEKLPINISISIASRTSEQEFRETRVFIFREKTVDFPACLLCELETSGRNASKLVS